MDPPFCAGVPASEPRLHHPLVVAHCLKIIATDLDCDISDITAANEECVQIEWIYFCLTQN
jgi:hypothetical protein